MTVYKVGQRWRRRDGESTRITDIVPFSRLEDEPFGLEMATFTAYTESGYFVTESGSCNGSGQGAWSADLVELLVDASDEKQVTTEPGPASTPPPGGLDGVPVKGLKFDGAKPGMGLVSPLAQLEEGMALTYGARKYAKHNYLQGLESSRVLGALMRHVLLLMSGEETDPESGVSHIGHIRANTAMWRDCQAQGTLVDDRPYNEKYTAELFRVANEWSVLSDKWTADAAKKKEG